MNIDKITGEILNGLKPGEWGSNQIHVKDILLKHQGQTSIQAAQGIMVKALSEDWFKKEVRRMLKEGGE